MRRSSQLFSPALLCAALVTIAAAPRALARGDDNRADAARVNPVDAYSTAIPGGQNGPQRGRGEPPAQSPDRVRQDFRTRHDADAFVSPVAGSIKVLARLPWTDSRITVRRGQAVSFQAVGSVFYSLDEGAIAGPDGIDNGRANRRQFPVRALGVCGLIGRVGNGAPFPIGVNSRPIVMPAGGHLYLGINDSDFNDNSGYFRVKVGVR